MEQPPIPNQKFTNDKLELYRLEFEKHHTLMSKIFGELDPDFERSPSGDYEDSSLQDQWYGALWALDYAAQQAPSDHAIYQPGSVPAEEVHAYRVTCANCETAIAWQIGSCPVCQETTFKPTPPR
jgi:hypothetical protein